MKKIGAVAAVLALLSLGLAAQAYNYSNGFESGTAGWYNATQTASVPGGIQAADGGYYALASGSPTYTDWGGYNFGAGDGVATAFQEYTTSLDIYLDLAGGWSNDTRFDWDSAISNAAGSHKRDYIFNAGFYDDNKGYGEGNRFVVSASNNSQRGSAFARNSVKLPFVIDTTGWYTFQHHFYNNGGVLAVDMSILANDIVLNTWTLSDPADVIGGIGGNQYGWFSCKEFNTTAFDNAQLASVPEPGTILAALTILGPAGLAFRRRRG